MSDTYVLLLVATLAVAQADAAAAIASNGGLKPEGSSRQESGRMQQIRSVVGSLYNDVISSQWPDTVNYSFPLGWGHLRGRFPNNIHLNFVGPPLMQMLRNALQFPDDNGFTDTFVLESLASAGAFLPEDAPLNDTVFTAALESAFENHDRYSPPSTPLFGFWPQKLIADSAELGPKYEQWSINLSNLCEDGELIDEFLKALLDALNLAVLYDFLIAPIQALFGQLLHVFSIPMDADDTGTTLILERHLSAAPLSTSRAVWRDRHFNRTAAFDVLRRHAYCPARVGDLNNGAIDPRSYFWARGFLNTLTDPDDCIITTWQTLHKEEAAVYANRSAKPLMPFNVNNIDPSVCANSLFSFSVAFLLHNDTQAWLEIASNRKLYETTARFVAWALERQRNVSRPDLETLYYPPTVNLPSFVGRHVHWLEGLRQADSGKPFRNSAVETVYQTLSQAARRGGTQFLLGSATNQCENGHCTGAFWNGFLGAADTDDWGKPTPHPDDRLFDTATALNAVVDIWSYQVEVSGRSVLRWLNDTRADVKATAQAATEFVLAALNSSNTSFENTFFSGSIHNMNTFPWDFPVSVYEDMSTGSRYGCGNFSGIAAIGDSTFLAVVGQIPETDYQRIIADGCGGFNISAAVGFEGFNSEFSPWPYWSSPILTKALTMAALSKVAVLED